MVFRAIVSPITLAPDLYLDAITTSFPSSINVDILYISPGECVLSASIVTIISFSSVFFNEYNNPVFIDSLSPLFLVCSTSFNIGRFNSETILAVLSVLPSFTTITSKALNLSPRIRLISIIRGNMVSSSLYAGSTILITFLNYSQTLNYLLKHQQSSLQLSHHHMG